MPRTQALGPIQGRRLPGRPGLLIVSLLWAVALWFYAREEMSAERDVKAFATFRAPAGRTLKLLDPPAGPGGNTVSVTVTVRGPRGKVYSLAPEDIRSSVVEAWSAQAGGKELPSGPIQVDLSPAAFYVPEHTELRVIGVRPSSVKLILAEAGRKLVPVRVIPKGQPRKGYIVPSRPRTIPGTVEVRAAPEILEKITFVETEPVDIEGKEASFSAFAELVQEVQVDGQMHRLITAPDQVVVVVDISPAPVTVQREHVPLRMLLPADAPLSFQPESPTLTVSIRGPEELIASIRGEDIKVLADASGLQEVPESGEAELPLRVLLPAGVELVPGSLPEKAKVKVKKCPE